MVQPSNLWVSTQKPIFLMFSSLQNSSERQDLTCLVFCSTIFGTETSIAEILVHENSWFQPAFNLIPTYSYVSHVSSRKSCFLWDESMLKFSYCAEFFTARTTNWTAHIAQSLLCGRLFSKVTLLYLNAHARVSGIITNGQNSKTSGVVCPHLWTNYPRGRLWCTPEAVCGVE